MIRALSDVSGYPEITYDVKTLHIRYFSDYPEENSGGEIVKRKICSNLDFK